MSDDDRRVELLEAELRDALAARAASAREHSLSQASVARGRTDPGSWRTRVPLAASIVFVILGAVALAVTVRAGSRDENGSGVRATGQPVVNVALAGVLGRWKLVGLSEDGDNIKLPARSTASISFDTQGQYGADGGANYRSGRFTLTPGSPAASLHLQPGATTLVLEPPGDEVAKATDHLIGDDESGATSTVQLTTGPRQMLLTNGSYRFLYSFISNKGGPPAPVASSTAR